MSNRVVVIYSGSNSYEYEKNLLTNAGYQFEVFPGQRHDREGKIRFAEDAVGMFIRWTDLNDEFLEAVPRLKAIVRYGVGYDNVDLDAVSRHNIKVSNVQGYANHSVSDHAMSLIYACTRFLKQGQENLKSHYGAPPDQSISELHTKTVGIIGLGRIGGTFCTKAKSLFKQVLAVDPYITDKRFTDLGADKTGLESLLHESDVISIHCNLTQETENLINMDKIKMMVKKPILVNTARGPIINEEHLIQALGKNMLHSVGLDVFCDEPPLENSDDLLKHPRVVATGHYAWYSKEASVELQKRAADNLLMMLQNKIPEDCLNP
jgi:D-3-phosphoglycerate dehydrogenase / 2-oxoglutarate reductase